MPSVLKIILVLVSLMLLTACQTDRRRCETETGGAATYRKSDNCGRAAKPAEGSDRPERQVREKPVTPTEPEPEGPVFP